MQDKEHSQYFKKDWFLDVMIINCENAASHKYVVQKALNFLNNLIKK